MCVTTAVDVGVSAVCCVGSAACSAVCCCCRKICNTTMKQQVRLSYVIMNITCVLLSTIVLYWIQELLAPFDKYIHCSGQSNLDCLGISAVYRMSFTLALFYCFILFCLLFRNQFSKSMNEGWWCIKFLLVIGGFFAFFFVDNNFFVGYTYFARYFGSAFLVIQSIMLIDLFYMWGENWVRSYDQGHEYMKWLLIGTALLLYGGTITLNVYNFRWFTEGGSDCGLNIFINILNIVLIVILTTIQLLGFNPNGSLICSGAQSLYMTFLTYSAQLSGPVTACNILSGKSITNGGIMALEIGVAVFLLIVVLLYLSFGTQESSRQRLQVGEQANLNEAVLPSQRDEDQEDAEDAEDAVAAGVVPPNQQKVATEMKNSTNSYQELNANSKNQEKSGVIAPGLKNYQNNQYFMFHFIMLVASIYICMLLTNWRQPSMNQSVMDAFQPSQASYWVQLIISWSSAGLYIWTLVAPKIFPDRDFGG